MPLFDFRCRSCNVLFEDLVAHGEEPECPQCGSPGAQRQLPVFAVGKAASASPAPSPGSCGTCGDPRGPGACQQN